jgi:hypothetical protein
MTKRTLRGLFPATALVAAVSIFAAACGGAAQTTTSAAAPTTVTSATAATLAPANATTTGALSGTPVTASGSIVVSGLVDYPMTLTPVDMDYMDWVTVTADDPNSGSTTYDGVRLSDIWSFFGVQAAARTVSVTAADGSTVELALADISSDALLAVDDDNSFNMVMPGMAASAWVKDVVAMKFV